MKILHYVNIKPFDGYTLAFCVYDYSKNAEKTAHGYFTGIKQMFEYIEKNDISDFFNVTYKINSVL